MVWVKNQSITAWNNYVALVGVAEENTRLREELQRTRSQITFSIEEHAELSRLRELLRLDALHEQPAFAARVITKRFGPQAVLKTLTVNKGFLDGVIVGTPVLTQNGVVGRILRTAPHASTVLMLTDPAFRLAVIGQESRTPGILSGSTGSNRSLEVAYVAQTAEIRVGETLITSGIDGRFPKGIPVGVVTQVTPGNEILFQQIHARPVVNLDILEEVLLLQETGTAPPLLDRLPNPLKQEVLLSPTEEAAAPHRLDSRPEMPEFSPVQANSAASSSSRFVTP